MTLAVAGSPLPVDSSDNGQRPTDNGKWHRLYVLVLAELALTIAIFYAFTKAFR